MTEQMKHYIKVFFFIFQLLGFPSPAQKIDTLKMVSVGQTLNDKSDLSCILEELHPRFKMGKCEYEMGIVGSEWFFNLLNKDLKTDIFNKIICVTSVEVSFFYHRAQCLVIQEWFFDGEDRSRTAKAYLDKIPETTIYYEPPHNWIWILKKNKIFFIYSESDKSESISMQVIKSTIEKLK